MNILSFYLIIFSAVLIFESFLEVLNLYKASSIKSVPLFFKNHVTEDDFIKSAEYTIFKGKFALVSGFYEAAVLLYFIFSGLFGRIEAFLERAAFHPYISGIFFIYIVMFILSAFMVPFGIYSEFVIEKKFGFSNMTLRLYIIDMLKGILLGVLLSFSLLLALFWFMDKTGNFWWVYAFLFTAIFQITITILYPLLIAPLFNKFEKLDDSELENRLFSLAKRLDFAVNTIFRMDGSKRSRHSNAYFTGFGKMRRIVLFDTLLTSLEVSELEAVLAHEIGHYKKHHLIKGIVLSLFVLLAGFYIISLLAGFTPLFTAFGFTQASYYGILVLVMLYSHPFTFLLTPFINMFSRKHEYEADSFAVKATGSADNMKNALLRLGRDNLSNLVPHKLYSFYHYSHPALSERLSAIDSQSQ
ncbi:MAG: M48 family metallopeptidase [Spirochaetia bacterium]|jgi:STE24 endopeptidase|nr:M48 family metallopeptidase [Spirochaetia bacterium]